MWHKDEEIANNNDEGTHIKINSENNLLYGFFFSGDIQAPDGQLSVLLGGEDGLVSDIFLQVVVHGRGGSE